MNIVQHPRGGYEKLSIRSNLVTGSTASELRYFTDTDIRVFGLTRLRRQLARRGAASRRGACD